MSSDKFLNTLKLSNGLTVSIYDRTKIYFGDYHHVKIVIYCSFDTAAAAMALSCPDEIDLRSVSYSRTLEKMGVPSVDVDTVIKSLLHDFHLNSLPYISSQEFPKKLINTELIRRKGPARNYTGSGV